MGEQHDATGSPPVLDSKVWMQTFMGVRFRLFEPDPEQVNLQDLAHSLAMQCRFSGHTPRYYSVAEHCILGSLVAPPQAQLAFLLHDAAEAYLGDVISPLKHSMGGRYREIEERISWAIQQRFNPAGGGRLLREYAQGAALLVEEIDLRMLATEAEALFGISASLDWGLHYQPYSGITLAHLSPEEAKRQYLARFYSLTQEVVYG